MLVNAWFLLGKYWFEISALPLSIIHCVTSANQKRTGCRTAESASLLAAAAVARVVCSDEHALSPHSTKKQFRAARRIARLPDALHCCQYTFLAPFPSYSTSDHLYSKLFHNYIFNAFTGSLMRDDLLCCYI